MANLQTITLNNVLTKKKKKHFPKFLRKKKVLILAE